MFIVHFKHAFQTYLEPYQTSAMEPFRNNSKRLEFLKYFRKSSIADVWKDSKESSPNFASNIKGMWAD